jgi:IS5 family transposase
LAIKLIVPLRPEVNNCKYPYDLSAMIRIQFMLYWYVFSDSARKGALYEIASMLRFAGFSLGSGAIPDDTTIRNFRHLPEANGLDTQNFEAISSYLIACGLKFSKYTIVDATIIAASSSTKNASGEIAPEMHYTKKGNEWHFGVKAHIGIDAKMGLVYCLQTTSANMHDLTAVEKPLTGEENTIFADAGYRGMEQSTQTQAALHIAMRPGKRQALIDYTKDRIATQLGTLKT